MAPFFTNNPYQSMIARALERAGHEVSAVDRDERSERDVLAGLPADADVLHLHWLHPYHARPGRLRALLACERLLRRIDSVRRSGGALVWTLHNLHDHEGRRPLLERRLASAVARRADRIVVHSETGRRLAAGVLGPDAAGRLAVCPHPHYLEAYPPPPPRAEARARLGLPEDRRVFLFFGRIRPYKGLLEVMDSFGGGELPGSPLLLVAGKAHDRRLRLRLKRRAKRRRDVRLLYGRVDPADVGALLAAADVALLPYRDVLTSGAALLFLGAGLPVVAPTLGDLGELVDASCGFPYDPDEPDGLRRALLEASRAEPGTLEALGRNARARVAGRDPDRVARRHVEIYREALARRAATSS